MMANGTPALLTVAWRGQAVPLAVWRRDGNNPPLLYLPGLGCAKEDILATVGQPALADTAVLALDWPGQGASPHAAACATLADCAALAAALWAQLGITRPLLVGHSMGGTIGLLCAEQYPVAGFINIEGNLAPENCSFSRESTRCDCATFAAEKLPAYLAKLRAAARPAARAYAATLALADPRALYAYGASLVDYSDSGTLVERYARLGCPTLYVSGSDNAGLTYLPALRAAGCRLAVIPGSG
ncbi:MAG TPA: alpha/beta hydrolase, partial [bacterium]|nr:alpha/beta hydrolase [bacterium]